MKPKLLVAAAALVAAGVAVPATLAAAADDDPTLYGLAGRALQMLGLADSAVQITALVCVAGLLGWRMWLQRPTPPDGGGHTIEEVYTLLNGLSDRLDALCLRLDQHIDQHLAR